MRLQPWSIALIAALLTAMAAIGPARAEPLKIVATTSVLGDLVKTVAGDKAAVVTLVGPDADVHTYQPVPSDAKAVADAALLVTNGLGLEGWLDRLRSAAQFKGAVVVAAAGIKPLMMDKEEEDAGAKTSKPKRVQDPHAWQNLANGQIYVTNIVAGLAAADPANADFYRQSGEAYNRQLAELDRKVKAELASIPKEKRRVITTHDAFQYYGKAYGISFIAPLGISTENEPSAGDVARLERQIKREHLKALFLENVASPRLIEQIAKDTGAVVGPPLYSDSLSKPDEPASTYVKMFEYNTATLKDGMLKN